MGRRKFRLLLIMLVMSILIMAAKYTFAGEKRGPVFLDQNFAGGRIGVWTNLGDEKEVGDTAYTLDFAKSSIYAEFFYAHRIARPLALEFQFGIYSRGEMEHIRNDTSDIFISTVNIYPVMITAKFYPLYKFERAPFHIFLQPGFGLVVGTQNIVDYDYYYNYGFDNSETRAKFSYMLGGGIDWPVADQIGLTFAGKYIPVTFGKALANAKDYSGWTLTFGIGYIFK